MGSTDNSRCSINSLNGIGDKEVRDRTVKDKIWHIIAIGTFVLLSIIVATALFWTIFPYQVSDVEVPVKILNKDKQIRIGEQIEMELIVSKPNDLKPEGTVFITCNDGNLVTMNSMTANLPKGDYRVVNNRYTLPPKVAVGTTCQFNFRNVYQVNPIRDITKDWYSEEFTVIK